MPTKEFQRLEDRVIAIELELKRILKREDLKDRLIVEKANTAIDIAKEAKRNIKEVKK